VTLTYPHVGNTGTTKLDDESNNVWCSGLVIRDLPLCTSSWRSEVPLKDYLIERNVVGIADIDTRKLTRILRNKGSLGACILAGDKLDEAYAIKQAKSFAGLKGMDLAKEVTTPESYDWYEGSWQLAGNRHKDENDLGKPDRKSTRLNSSHVALSRMPSSA